MLLDARAGSELSFPRGCLAGTALPSAGGRCCKAEGLRRDGLLEGLLRLLVPRLGLTLELDDEEDEDDRLLDDRRGLLALPIAPKQSNLVKTKTFASSAPCFAKMAGRS